MSAAALVMLARESKPAVGSISAKTLRVNEPGDAYEREADKVADTVVAGGRVSNWSLSASGAGLIQRDPTTAAGVPTQPPPQMIGDSQDPPAANNYGDMLGKLAEALLKTEAGRTIAKYVEDQPIAKGAKDFVQTPAGIVVAGGTAIAAISGLAAAGKGLPAQLPDIPLDRLHPGLSVKIDIEGPLNHPTQGSLMFTFGAAPPKKKKGGATDGEKYRAQTARMAEEMKFGAGVDPGKLGPVPSAEAQERQAEAKAVEAYELRRMGSILQPGAASTPGQFTPLVPGSQPMSLGMRDNAFSGGAQGGAKDDKSKKEEIPVQRKAERAVSHEGDVGADVEAVLAGSGRPLDRETRRVMESRIGFDFSKVRIHTDTRAAASAKTLGARAYTVGDNVVFAAGRFSPNSTEGRRLLAHELTHVVQQSPNRAARSAVGVARLPIAIAAGPQHIQREEDPSGAPEAQESRVWRWLRERLRPLEEIPGYRLFSVIYGKDIVENKRVESNATSITEAVVDLAGAQQTYEQIKASGALSKAYEWLKVKLNDNQLTGASFKSLLEQAFDIAESKWGSPFAALDEIKALFRRRFDQLVAFAKEAVAKLFEIAIQATLEAIGGEQIAEVLTKARDTFQLILKNPVAFLKNLFAAVKQGFLTFKDHVGDYLKEGLVAWLSDELKSAGIPMPKSFSLKEIGGIALQVLKITKEDFRARVAAAVGEKAFAQIESGLTIVKEVQDQGVVALWNHAVAYAGNLTETVVSTVRDWATKNIVATAIRKLAPLLTPVGAAIEAVSGAIKTAKFIFGQIRKITALVGGIVDSIADIASANIVPAAKKIVENLVHAIPLVLNFLAGYLNLKIGQEIGEILKSIRDPIDKAINKVLELIVAKARALLSKGKQTLNKALQWWKERRDVTVNNIKHKIYIEGPGDHPQVIMESTPTPLERFLVQAKATDDEKAEIFALIKKLRWSADDEKKNAAAASPSGEGMAAFDQIVEKVGHLKSTKDKPYPKPKFAKPQITNSFGGGVVADVFLTPILPNGSPPEQTSPRILSDLGHDLIKTKTYIRGHLLNQQLGGEGKWANMMPITNSANLTMSNRAEQKVIKALASGKVFIHYTVEAKYDETITGEPIAPDRAEQRLEMLSWKWNPADFEDGQWKDKDIKDVPEDVPKDQKDMMVGNGGLDPKQTKATKL